VPNVKNESAHGTANRERENIRRGDKSLLSHPQIPFCDGLVTQGRATAALTMNARIKKSLSQLKA